MNAGELSLLRRFVRIHSAIMRIASSGLVLCPELETRAGILEAPRYSQYGAWVRPRVLHRHHPEAEDWEGYAARFQFFLQARGVTEDSLKRAIFLSECGREMFEIACALFVPAAIDTIDFKEVMDQLKQHFSWEMPGKLGGLSRI